METMGGWSSEDKLPIFSVSKRPSQVLRLRFYECLIKSGKSRQFREALPRATVAIFRGNESQSPPCKIFNKNPFSAPRCTTTAVAIVRFVLASAVAELASKRLY